MNKQRQYVVKTLMIGMLATAAIGCAANIPQTRDARAAGEWQARLPTTPSTFGKLAYGSGGSSEPSRVVEPESQPLMATATQTKKLAKSAKLTPRVAAKPAQPEPLPAAKVAPVEPPVLLASNAEPDPQQRYAERENKAQKLQEYRGGDAVVISGSVLLIVLLVVILVLLLR